MSLQSKITAYIHKKLEKEIIDTEKYLEDLCDCSNNFETRPLRFHVYIHNAWGSYPNTYDAESKGKDLLKTLKRAIAKFKELNRRSDVQGDLRISAIMSKGVKFYVPNELHDEITSEMKRYVPTPEATLTCIQCKKIGVAGSIRDGVAVYPCSKLAGSYVSADHEVCDDFKSKEDSK